MRVRSNRRSASESRFSRTAKCGAILFLATLTVVMAHRGRCDDLRISTMGGCWIALDDEDNHVNPYDFGRNPAYLLGDFEAPWTRLDLGASRESGALRRPYDPEKVEDFFAGASGRQRLGERHVIWGDIRLERVNHKHVSHELEIDQYNDPFYLTDQTTGDFQYNGPSMSVDYSLRLWQRFVIGGGLDYDICKGIKDTYTRPEIVHNNFVGNLGVVYEPAQNWALGAFARPIRLQNRTEFAKTDEGFDNLLYRYYGDGIYDIFAVSSYTVRDNLEGWEFGAQSFVMKERYQAGLYFKYRQTEDEVTYGTSTQHLQGYWQSTVYDAGLLSRYTLAQFPLTLGLTLRYAEDHGWAKRPEFEGVLLYENPVDVASLGVGASYRIEPIKTLLAVDYVANAYDIKVFDYGAKAARSADIVQNIGRLGLEYALFDLHSIRAGVEVTDYLVDRWLKLPPNSDRYKFTGGFRYRAGYWDVEAYLGYALSTKENTDAQREDFSGIIRFVHLLN